MVPEEEEGGAATLSVSPASWGRSVAPSLRRSVGLSLLSSVGGQFAAVWRRHHHRRRMRRHIGGTARWRAIVLR